MSCLNFINVIVYFLSCIFNNTLSNPQSLNIWALVFHKA